MAGRSTKRVARRSLALLIVIVIGLGALAGGLAVWGGGQLTPRLGLDLEGGTELVLEPVLLNKQQVSPKQIDQAVDIIRQRIDANGVSEAQISTLGGQNIDVAIPGTPTAEQLQAIRKPSKLSFRAVFVEARGGLPEAITPPTAPTTPSGTATGTPATPTSPEPSGTASKKPSAPANPSGSASPSSTAANGVIPEAFSAATTPVPTPTTPTGTPTTPAKPSPPAASSAPGATTPAPVPTAPQQPTPAQLQAGLAAQVTKGLTGLGWQQARAASASATVAKNYLSLDCSKPGAVDKIVDDPALPIATCGDDRQTKYVLGPVEIEGKEIANATSGFQAGPNGQPTSIVEVGLSFNSTGAAKFAKVTKRLFGLKADPPRNQFAVVLDKVVITAPRSEAVITDGKSSITGSFTTDSAKALAQQLKFGALPISFALQTQDDITPQVGGNQLVLGLLAGALGLLLVVVYSLFQYRALGLVTVLSLVVAAALSYLAVTVLGTTLGFRLTLAGVTGLIVAIGVTADSFIVYFERVRDEVRDGRPLQAAVETGWKRARRTIIAADAVNFMAAAVLYFLASSNVRGFAFTLGLTTLIDLVVVVLFTHPMVQLLARTDFFGNGHKWSGLDPERLGAKESPRYRGRGQFGTGPRATTTGGSGATAFTPRKAQS